MSEKLYLFSIIFSLFLIIGIIELIRRKKLLEKYSLGWLFFAFFIFLLSIFRNILESLAKFIGIYYPPSALFFIGFILLIIILLHFSTVISELYRQNVILTQEFALLKEKFERYFKEDER